MSGADVLAFVRRQGLKLSSDGSELRVRGRLSLFTPSIRSILKYYREEVIEALMAEERRPAVETVRPRLVTSLLEGPPKPVPPPRLVAARFAHSVECELRRNGGRWTMWVAVWGGRFHRRDFASPHLGHAQRCAEEWYGPTREGWSEDSDA